jgi:hypothetical protein
VIGNGVVVDPRVLIEELDALRARRIDTSGSAGEARLGRLQIGRLPTRALST